MLSHLFGNVGVEVHGDADGHCVADNVADIFQKRSFRVLNAFHHHGPVEGDENSVQGISLLNIFNKQGLDIVVDIPLDSWPRQGIGSHRRDDLNVIPLREDRDKCPDFILIALEIGQDFVANQQVASLEILYSCMPGNKGIGLLLKLCNKYGLHFFPSEINYSMGLTR